MSGAHNMTPSEVVSLSAAELLEAHELMYAAGWTDGLPVLPPLRHLVDEFVRSVGRHPDESIGEVPPLGGRATVERVAANAVMAGCRPEYLPVVITALEAMLEPRFNLNGMQCSTHMGTPLVIVHGPIRRELDVNCGANVFGQGWRANATIGRAVKLVLVNIGGARPGTTDKSTLGHMGKYTYCIGENEEQSPWEPLHVERGLRPEDSAVTVFGGEGPHNMGNQMQHDAFDLMTCMASLMANLGSNNPFVMGESFVVLGPEHAAVCAAAGWKKRDVRQFLFETARVEHRRLKLGGVYAAETDKYNFWPRWIDRRRDDVLVPVCREANDINILVAGGPGKHSAYIPGWGSRSVTRKIERPGGTR
jgi:hypothetical protein